MPKALLFDLDGTLCNTDAVHFPNWIEILRPHGIEVTRELYEDKLSGRDDEESVRELLPDLSEEETRELLRIEEFRARQRASEIGPHPGLRALLGEAYRRGVRLALVTNSTQEDAAEVLQPLGLDGIFDPVFFPSQVEESKPAGVPYDAALDNLGISPDEAVAFEDSPTGAKAAVEANIPVVGIASGHSPEELIEAGVAIVVGDFADPALYEFLGWS